MGSELEQKWIGVTEKTGETFCGSKGKQSKHSFILMNLILLPKKERELILQDMMIKQYNQISDINERS